MRHISRNCLNMYVHSACVQLHSARRDRVSASFSYVMRHPRLKVDWLFANESEQESRGPSSIQYVKELRERLTDNYAIADEHVRAQGKANKRRYDQRVRPSGLEVGGRVLLRNVAIHEIRKLSNRWLPDVYVVLRQQGANGLQFT